MKANGYIDMHSHILPGVDDGSGSMEETIQMLQIAIEQRIECIIATPHYAIGAKNVSVEHLQKVKEQVQVEANKLNAEFKLLLGNELYYSESIISALKSKEALTLADSRYVLVEFSVREDYKIMYRGLGDLIRAGYAPILAHMERYHCLGRQEERIVELIDLGCYIQMNSNTLLGSIFDMDVKCYRKLLNKGLIHLIASDSHDQRVRIPKMKDTMEALRKKCDEKIINQIFNENPLKIIENIYI